MQLHDKVALIVNADSDLGVAIAGQLHHGGAHVALHH